MSEERILQELKRSSDAYSAYKQSFVQFCTAACAVLANEPDLRATVECQTDHSIRLSWIDHLVQIDLSMVMSSGQPKGVLRFVEIERDGEREMKKELARIYFDHLGNASNNPSEWMSLENIRMSDGATSVLLRWLHQFLNSERFSVPTAQN